MTDTFPAIALLEAVLLKVVMSYQLKQPREICYIFIKVHASLTSLSYLSLICLPLASDGQHFYMHPVNVKCLSKVGGD